MLRLGPFIFLLLFPNLGSVNFKDDFKFIERLIGTLPAPNLKHVSSSEEMLG